MADDALKPKTLRGLVPGISIKILIVAALFLVSLLVLSYIVHEAVIEQKAVFDPAVILFVSRYTSETVISVMKVVTFFGSNAFLLPAYTLINCYLLYTGRKTDAVNITVVALSGSAFLHMLKNIFHRHRPGLPLVDPINTYSFPSGHALSSLIFSCILIHLAWHMKIHPALKWLISSLLLLLPVLIGLSRIVLKVHYPTDVIASFCLGFIWLSLSFIILTKLNRITQGR